MAKTLDDLTLARKFAEEYHDRLRYVHDEKMWRLWDGRIWSRDTNGAVERAVQKTILVSRQRVVASRVSGVLSIAKSQLELAAVHADFNQNPMLLTVGNGTLDLRDGSFRPSDPADMLTRSTSVNYDPDAKCPRWMQFLDETFSDQKEVIPFLQRSIGYSLTGSTAEEVLWLLIGNGQNGKSTLFNVLRPLLGAYAASPSFKVFLRQKDGASPVNPRDGMAQLVDIRLALASESDTHRELNESLIKTVTSGEPITTATLYEQEFTFDPQFKLWLATNYEPKIKGTDEGIWRRIIRVNFNQAVPTEKKDPHLAEKLCAELPGILNWALEGLREYQKQGLSIPDCVRMATMEYRTEQDQLARFLEECGAVERVPEGEIPASTLYDLFEGWAEGSNERPMAQRTFGQMLPKHGIGKTKRGQLLYTGVRLKPNQQVCGSSGCELPVLPGQPQCIRHRKGLVLHANR